MCVREIGKMTKMCGIDGGKRERERERERE